MGFWQTVRMFTQENTELVWACALAVFLLCLGVFLVVNTGRAGVYLAVSAVAGGAFALFVLAYKIEAMITAYTASILFILDGVLYLLAVAILHSRQKVWERRARRTEDARRLLYALPDRENTFVQARLNTVLRTDYGEDGLPTTEQVDLGYAKKLLADVLAKPLSAGERLQAENIGKTLGVYLQKPRWSATDLRAVNDTFSVLMKLCSKYSVSV